ncbi:MAG: DUF692 domain-containing protein [Elusimicrobiota bacterium]
MKPTASSRPAEAGRTGASAFVGVGLRPPHYSRLLKRTSSTVQWFEALSENFMDTRGRPLQALESARKDYPIALHGISMSVGSAEGIRPGYLKRLKALADRIDPFLVSDHLCWTGPHASNTRDLLPLPQTEEAVRSVVREVERAHTELGRRIALENVSSYLSFKGAEMKEWEFLVEVAKRSGCGILLDINNVYVNSVNHGFDPQEYLDGVPTDLVAQIHLAGHTDMGTHLFDTHSAPVADVVWDLYARTARRLAAVPVLIEWDDDIPEFAELERQAEAARRVWEKANEKISA